LSDSHSGAKGGDNAPKAGHQPPLEAKKKKKNISPGSACLFLFWMKGLVCMDPRITVV